MLSIEMHMALRSCRSGVEANLCCVRQSERAPRPNYFFEAKSVQELFLDGFSFTVTSRMQYFTQWFRNPDKSPLSSLNRELKSGCCLDSRGSVSGFSLILFQNPDKTTASASRYGTRESRYGSRAESR